VPFQEATTRPGLRYHPPRDLMRHPAQGDDGEEPPWLQDLRERCARAVLPLTAVHGDFWIRNLLMRRDPGTGGSWSDGAGVVDWEDFQPIGSPFTDLFHFAMTYVLNFPWSRYRRRPPVQAFRLGFIHRNVVSRQVRDFFMEYCARTGTDPRLLTPIAQVYLLERARQKPDSDVWLRCHELLQQAAHSVLTPE
jgi:aminoglycoside phosphotransferase (APT) family kinase protein